MSSLATLGGSPAVTQPAPHFSWPPLDRATEQAVVRQLGTAISIYDRSGVIAELEDALCEYHGVRHALLTSSGTAAIYSMYAGAGLQAGDEVIVPAYTFFATVTPLLHLGAVPVLADCDATGNVDPHEVADLVTPRTRALVVTHMWGLPADTRPLRQLADKHRLLFFEDGSHAHGARRQGAHVGTFADAAAFSMNGPKPLSAGEGGFILTSRDSLFNGALMHGQYNKRCRQEIPPHTPLYRMAVTGHGLKHRIHPLAAAIALDQLRRLDGYLETHEHGGNRAKRSGRVKRVHGAAGLPPCRRVRRTLVNLGSGVPTCRNGSSERRRMRLGQDGIRGSSRCQRGLLRCGRWASARARATWAIRRSARITGSNRTVPSTA